jgi:hypothetical protein
LTIACHLRFGAEALCRMTTETLVGLPTAYYPNGRDEQRPATLKPKPDERPSDVALTLALDSAALNKVWAGLTDAQ